MVKIHGTGAARQGLFEVELTIDGKFIKSEITG